MMRVWAVEGRGVIMKNSWDVEDDLRAGTLETALDEFTTGQVELYAVTSNGVPSRRTAALVDFIAERLR